MFNLLINYVKGYHGFKDIKLIMLENVEFFEIKMKHQFCQIELEFFCPLL